MYHEKYNSNYRNLQHYFNFMIHSTEILNLSIISSVSYETNRHVILYFYDFIIFYNGNSAISCTYLCFCLFNKLHFAYAIVFRGEIYTSHRQILLTFNVEISNKIRNVVLEKSLVLLGIIFMRHPIRCKLQLASRFAQFKQLNTCTSVLIFILRPMHSDQI